jgi:hypothetical protein
LISYLQRLGRGTSPLLPPSAAGTNVLANAGGN